MGRTDTSVSARLGAVFGFMPLSVPALNAGGTHSVDSLEGGILRILTWNVHKQVDGSWNRDFENLLDEHQPSLLHLQEARVDSVVAALSRRRESWSWMASPNLILSAAGKGPASDAPVHGASVGVLTAARAPLQQGVAMLSAGSEPILGSRKPMLRCGFPFQNSLNSPSRHNPGPGDVASALCLNIHSLNFSLGLEGFGGQLDSLLQSAAGHRGPIIFSGDFNTWSRRRMDLLLGKTEAAGLRRAAFPGDRPMRWLSTKSLDHVFYSQEHFDLAPGSARILDSIRSSDHAPLLVDLVFKDKPPGS